MGEVRLETADGILTVTLAEVESRNALGATILNGLHDAITEANAAPEIRAVVVTNEGTTFCAGANLKQQSGAAKGDLPKLGFDALLSEIYKRLGEAGIEIPYPKRDVYIREMPGTIGRKEN